MQKFLLAPLVIVVISFYFMSQMLFAGYAVSQFPFIDSSLFSPFFCILYIILAIPFIKLILNKNKSIALLHIREKSSYPDFRFLGNITATIIWLIAAIFLLSSYQFMLASVREGSMWDSVFKICGYVFYGLSLVFLYLGKLLNELLSTFCDIADSSIESSPSSKNTSN